MNRFRSSTPGRTQPWPETNPRHVGCGGAITVSVDARADFMARTGRVLPQEPVRRCTRCQRALTCAAEMEAA